MTSLQVPKDTPVKTLLSEIMPQVAKESLEANNAEQELAGTEITMVVSTESDSFTYVLKGGKDIDVKEGAVDNAMLELKVSESDIKKMIEDENLDMLLGMQSDLTRSKYNALSSLKGSFVAEISDGDHIYKMEAKLNGAASPNSLFKMSMQDSAALVNKETNPVNLFMSGAMKIEGDMAFAMATQPLFT